MDIKPTELAAAISAKPLTPVDDALPIRGISTDTRTLEKDDAFFALKGPLHDGHEYLREAFEKGARHFVVSDAKALPSELKKEAVVFVVADTLTAYGDLAKYWRQKFKIPVVAITGSSGKTTAKELVAHVLSQHFEVLKNKGTENNLVGVPKTILQLDAKHEVLVLELGTNAPGEIERLASIAAPQIGAVTQIGLSHLQGLKSVEGVKTEKLSLVKHLERGGVLVLNGQDPMLKDVSSGVHRVLRVGFSRENADVVGDQLWCHEKGTSFRVGPYAFEPAADNALVETQLIGRHNVLNCLFAMTVAGALGVDLSVVQKAIASFKPVPGRLAMRKIGGIQFLDDTYNSNPGSFKAALDTLKEFKVRERKVVVCGDMLELGECSEELHRQAGKYLAGLLFDEVIAVGPQCKFLVDEALKSGFDASRIRHAKDSAEAGRLCRESAKEGDFVLVKGSRGMRMEKVFDCFTTSFTR